MRENHVTRVKDERLCPLLDFMSPRKLEIFFCLDELNKILSHAISLPFDIAMCVGDFARPKRIYNVWAVLNFRQKVHAWSELKKLDTRQQRFN
jgi:hypothetical protein